MTYELAIILPAFKETYSISETIRSLIREFDSRTIFVIVDDSPNAISSHFASLEFASRPEFTWFKINSGGKRGRGSAVKDGFEFVNSRYGNIPVIEMDSDGSHSSKDTKKIFNALKAGNDFVIGSRYLRGSVIQGWPILRRIFSKLLNITLGKVFGIDLSDWTNGLRGYSGKAVNHLLKEKQTVEGFIYLTEQVLCLNKKEIYPVEIVTYFRNRTHGESTVGLNELCNSLIGVLKLRRKYR